MMSKKRIKRGEIWLVEFPPTKEDRKPTRPCLVISNDVQNEYGKWVVAVPFTTDNIENIEPFEVYVKNTKETGLDHPSKLKFNYPRTVDRDRLEEYLGKVDRRIIEQSKQAWKVAFDVEDW